MGWSPEAGRGRLLGWGQGRCRGACVPGRVVSPIVPPRRPASSHQELVATGHCVRGHPAWPGLGRPVLSVSSWLFSVSLTTMLGRRQGKEQARGVTGSACGHLLSPRYTGDSQLGHSADPWPRTQVRRVGTVAGTCQPHAERTPAACPVCFQSPGRPALSPASASVFSCWWNGAITGGQMPLRAVPIPVGDAMPRGRGRAPSEALASWSWHPSLAWGSQPDGGREVLHQPRGSGRKAQPGPWPQVWRAVSSAPSTGAPPRPRPWSLTQLGGDPVRAVLTHHLDPTFTGIKAASSVGPAPN